MSDCSTKDIGPLQSLNSVREREPAIVGEEGYTNTRHGCVYGESADEEALRRENRKARQGESRRCWLNCHGHSVAISVRLRLKVSQSADSRKYRPPNAAYGASCAMVGAAPNDLAAKITPAKADCAPLIIMKT